MAAAPAPAPGAAGEYDDWQREVAAAVRAAGGRVLVLDGIGCIAWYATAMTLWDARDTPEGERAYRAAHALWDLSPMDCIKDPKGFPYRPPALSPPLAQARAEWDAGKKPV
jgi:hypothetical protein